FASSKGTLLHQNELFLKPIRKLYLYFRCVYGLRIERRHSCCSLYLFGGHYVSGFTCFFRLALPYGCPVYPWRSALRPACSRAMVSRKMRSSVPQPSAISYSCDSSRIRALPRHHRNGHEPAQHGTMRRARHPTDHHLLERDIKREEERKKEIESIYMVVRGK
ncbi:hypothetical protein BIW11_11326, partial [Tropilaelaps mercedesae]